MDESPFASVDAAATASDTFQTPRAGVPLPSGGVAFIAALPATETEPVRAGLLIAEPDGEPSVLYSGAALVNPFDLDLAADGQSLYVADSVFLDADGVNAAGAILNFSLAGGEPTSSAVGYLPRAVTVAETGDVFFSGRDPESGAPGVFRRSAGDDVIDSVYSGAPLVDPSGIAVFRDGRVLVADTSLSDDDDSTLGSRGGVVLLENGSATVFVSGFETGYPAGVALTKDERNLIVSGQGADSSNLVFIFDTTNPEADPYVETGFASRQWSSAGLHRALDRNTFAWCDSSAEDGTVYSITAR